MGFGGRRGGCGGGGASAASARNITRHLLQSSAYYNDGARVNVCVCGASLLGLDKYDAYLGFVGYFIKLCVQPVLKYYMYNSCAAVRWGRRRPCRCRRTFIASSSSSSLNIIVARNRIESPGHIRADLVYRSTDGQLI